MVNISLFPDLESATTFVMSISLGTIPVRNEQLCQSIYIGVIPGYKVHDRVELSIAIYAMQTMAVRDR